MYLALPCTSWYEINEMTLFIQPNGKERFYQAARIGVLPSATSQILSFLTPLSATSVLCLAAVWKICACAQSCPSLCDPVGYSLLSSSIHAIFFWQGSWSGLPFPPPRDFPYPGIKLVSPLSPALAGRFFTTVPLENYCLWKPAISVMLEQKRNWDILVIMYFFLNRVLLCSGIPWEPIIMGVLIIYLDRNGFQTSLDDSFTLIILRCDLLIQASMQKMWS